ncbi:MAG: hypothetical protein ACPGSC_01700 [Granulosicoccaceae bacterium]
MDPQQRERVSAAFQAYNAMETTRQRHFDYLNMLTEREKRYNLQSSEIEQGFLAGLLADHDAQVKAFKTASDALREQSAEDFQALFTWLGEIEKNLAPIRQADDA